MGLKFGKKLVLSSLSKNKGIIVALALFIVLAAADLISTLSIGSELLYYLEANPLFKYIGIPGILLINILYVVFFYWVYNRSNSTGTRFMIMNFIVTLILIRIAVVSNNIQVALNPPTIEMAMQVTEALKQEALIKIGSMAALPFIAGILSFIFFKLDHRIEKK